MIILNEEQFEKQTEKLYRAERRAEFFSGILGCVRTIVYTPLSVAFHVVSFIARGVGFLSSFGLIVGVYYLYQAFSAVANGAAFSEVDTFTKAITFIVIPFAAYAISVITERIYEYFEDHSF